MAEAISCETSVHFYETPQRNALEDGKLYKCMCFGRVKDHKKLSFTDDKNKRNADSRLDKDYIVVPNSHCNRNMLVLVRHTLEVMAVSCMSQVPFVV
jgi:hypothetical protein